MEAIHRVVDEIVSNLVSEAQLHLLTVQQAQQQFNSASSVGAANALTKDCESEATPSDPTSFSADNVPEAGDSSNNEAPELLSGSESESSNHAKHALPEALQALPGVASEAQTTEVRQPKPRHPGNRGTPGGTLGNIEAPEFVAKNSKLQALKQRRLGSLSSSLDLSRESSFDSALQHAALNQASSSLQNSLAGATANNSTSAMQDDADLNQQASFSLAPMPLDSTTGVLSVQKPTCPFCIASNKLANYAKVQKPLHGSSLH